MTDVSQLGGGYADSMPDPEPTVEAVLQAARPDAHLVVIAGPPGVGKSAATARIVELLPNSLWLDKDITASGFILQSARDRGLPESAAYGHEHYHRHLRPHEYAGPTAQAPGPARRRLGSGTGRRSSLDRPAPAHRPFPIHRHPPRRPPARGMAPPHGRPGLPQRLPLVRSIRPQSHLPAGLGGRFPRFHRSTVSRGSAGHPQPAWLIFQTLIENWP